MAGRWLRSSAARSARVGAQPPRSAAFGRPGTAGALRFAAGFREGSHQQATRPVTVIVGGDDRSSMAIVAAGHPAATSSSASSSIARTLSSVEPQHLGLGPTPRAKLRKGPASTTGRAALVSGRTRAVASSLDRACARRAVEPVRVHVLDPQLVARGHSDEGVGADELPQAAHRRAERTGGEAQVVLERRPPDDRVRPSDQHAHDAAAGPAGQVDVSRRAARPGAAEHRRFIVSPSPGRLWHRRHPLASLVMRSSNRPSAGCSGHRAPCRSPKGDRTSCISSPAASRLGARRPRRLDVLVDADHRKVNAIVRSTVPVDHRCSRPGRHTVVDLRGRGPHPSRNLNEKLVADGGLSLAGRKGAEYSSGAAIDDRSSATSTSTRTWCAGHRAVRDRREAVLAPGQLGDRRRARRRDRATGQGDHTGLPDLVRHER